MNKKELTKICKQDYDWSNKPSDKPKLHPEWHYEFGPEDVFVDAFGIYDYGDCIMVLHPIIKERFVIYYDIIDGKKVLESKTIWKA